MRCHEVDYEIFGDDMQIVEVELDPQETVIAEAGAMNYMEEGIGFESKMGDGTTPSSGMMSALLNVGKRVLTGETDLLGPTFFADPQPEHFTQILDAEGFYAPPRSYPFATDRLSDTLRLRLETRPDQVMIMIDDGARIR